MAMETARQNLSDTKDKGEMIEWIEKAFLSCLIMF